MDLVDVHCHLNHARFKEDLEETLTRAKARGIKKIIINGVNSSTNREVLALSKKYEIIDCALGAYPFDALNYQSDAPDELGLQRDEHLDLDKEIAFWKRHQEDFVAVGEVGMDFSDCKDRKDEQITNFKKVIQAAVDMQKPIIVHTRKAEQECVDVLLASGIDPAKVVLHCCTAKKRILKQALEAGMNFSIPAIVHRLQHFQMLIDIAPIEQLLTETDSPWLSPLTGQRNEPAHVTFSIKKIAEIKKISVEDAAKQIFSNYQRIFA